MDQAIYFVIATVCVLALAYRIYGIFFVSKVLAADDSEVTPSHQFQDGKNYVPTKKWVNAGQHFAAIAAAGPLVGPVLAAQFGYLPGFIWLLVGAVVGGAVHDTVVLFASMKHQGKSLSEVAKSELGPVAGWSTGLAMLFIITITMAGLSIVVVHALERNAWGTFAVFMTVPIAIALGLYERYFGSSKWGTYIGVAAVVASVAAGPHLQGTVLGDWLTLHKTTVCWLLPIYAFFATALPVWMLLTPRGYLSSFMKIGVFAALIVGVVFINPTIQFPAVTDFIYGGGPILKGAVWPFISITIACGAISGFHAFIGSGTTPKLVDKWSDIRPVAFGGMLAECLVAVMALVAATSLHPADYFAINSTPEVFKTLGMQVVDLPELSAKMGIDLYGRTGGAVTLAVGMTYIFTKLSWFSDLAAYFFQFVIMFEAVFILTAVDSGTRVSRYLIQDLLGDLFLRVCLHGLDRRRRSHRGYFSSLHDATRARRHLVQSDPDCPRHAGCGSGPDGGPAASGRAGGGGQTSCRADCHPHAGCQFTGCCTLHAHCPRPSRTLRAPVKRLFNQGAGYCGARGRLVAFGFQQRHQHACRPHRL